MSNCGDLSASPFADRNIVYTYTPPKWFNDFENFITTYIDLSTITSDINVKLHLNWRNLIGLALLRMTETNVKCFKEGD